MVTTPVLYLKNRYYDPTTAQFLSVDPALSVTQSPYSYTYNDPMNAADPTGLFGWSTITGVAESVVSVVHTVAKVTTTVAGSCAVVAGVTGAEALAAGCGTVAAVSAGVQAASGAILTATGHESMDQLATDLISSGLTLTGVGTSQLARIIGTTADELIAAASDTPWSQVLSKGGLYLAGGAYVSLAAIAQVLGLTTEALANVKDWGELDSLVRSSCGNGGS